MNQGHPGQGSGARSGARRSLIGGHRLALALVVVIGCSGLESVALLTADGGEVHGNVYGRGRHAVVLAHGGRFTKESWRDQIPAFRRAGLRVLAIDFRGHGESRGRPGSDDRYEGAHNDVLAAVRYLRATGASIVSVVGASFGGWAAAEAVLAAEPGEIDRLVLLASAGASEPERVSGRKLFIVTRDDFRGDGELRLPEIRDHYQRSPEPKELVILEGSAHAQSVFDSNQGEHLLSEILRFLTEP